jgi:hypothetical protein
MNPNEEHARTSTALRYTAAKTVVGEDKYQRCREIYQMSEKIDISIRIPSDAQSRGDTPYMEHTKFIKYCEAYNVYIYEYGLEIYEKEELLFPCFRILYPRELLRRDFRANYLNDSKSYKIRAEWAPLVNLQDLIFKSQHWMYKEFEEAIEHGHPLEQAINDKNPYIVKPETQRFIKWERYNVIVGKHDSNNMRESRAKHYYSPWKVFFVYDLKTLNTDEHNRATGSRRGWGIVDGKLRHSSLVEFNHFYSIVNSFTYRRSLLSIYYFEKTSRTQQDWKLIVKRKRHIAKGLFSGSIYAEWIRFLRKLIELHERYRGDEKILLSLEAKSSIAKTVIFLRNATDCTFEKICADVSGKFKKRSGVGLENGVQVYPGRLEELFPDEKWDLEQNVRWRLDHQLKEFNSHLVDNEKIPESLADDLFDNLSTEPSGTALAAIRKINKFYFEDNIWRENEVWSAIRDLAVSLEVHGKQWLGGDILDKVLTRLFPSLYDALKKKTGIPKPTYATNSNEFLDKLDVIKKAMTPADERCGGHLIIANLTRNFTSHQKGLSDKYLHENIPIIYSSLIGTLFVLYAKYKGV